MTLSMPSIPAAVWFSIAVLCASNLGDSVAAAQQGRGTASIGCATACRIVIDGEQQIDIAAGGRQEVPLTAGLHLVEASVQGKVILKKVLRIVAGERQTVDVAEQPSDESRAALATLSKGCWKAEAKARKMKDQCPVDSTESWFVCFLPDLEDPGLTKGNLSHMRMDMLAMGDITMNQMSACMEKVKGVSSVMIERDVKVRGVGAAPLTFVSTFSKCASRDCEGVSREEHRGRVELDGAELRLIGETGERLVFKKYEKGK